MRKLIFGTILCILSFPAVASAELCMGERTVDPAVPHRNAALVEPGIRLVNGSVTCSHVDLHTAGRVMGLSMRRVYRSDMQFDGPLGQGWTGDYFQAAWRDEGSGDLLWHDADGFLHTFVHRNDAWRSPPGVYVHATYADDAVSLRRADGTVLDFNTCGQLSSITDRHGNAVTLGYDAGHQLQSVTDDRGFNWEFVHDANGRIVQLIDHVWETESRDARVVEYEYDASGRLVRVKLPETARYNDEAGNRVTWQYDYDAAGRLTGIFAPNQVAVGGVAWREYEYDEAGRVVSFRDGDASSWHYLRYTVNGNEKPIVRHIDPRGVRTDYKIDGRGRAARVKRYTGFWDVNHDDPIDHDYVAQVGPQLRAGDPVKFVTVYGYNRGHQITSIDYPAGNREEFAYPDATRLEHAHATTVSGSVITLDGAEWMPGEFAGGYVRLGGSLAEFAYYEVAGNTADTITVTAVDLNAQGWDDGAKFVVFTENPDKLAAGNLLAHRRVSADAGQADIVESFTYEPYYQQLRSATSARGYTTTYEYGFDTTGDPADGDLALKRTPQVDVLQTDGTALSAVFETHYGYNAYGQLVSTTDPEGSVETRSYYASGDRAGFLESIVQADGVLDLTESFEYDKTGLLTGQYPPCAFEAGATADDFKTSWRVNELGRRWFESGPVVADGARVETYRYFDANGNETHNWRSYVTASGDAPAAPGDEDDPDSFTKNSAPMAATWVETARAFDLANRLTAETSDAIAGAPVETVTWSYEYDAVGNRTARISPLLNLTAWEYDERDLVLHRVEGAGSAVEGTFEFDYSPNGNLAAERTPLGNETPHAFDGFEREVRIQDPAGGAREFEYDASDNLTTERCVDAAEQTLSETNWGYDQLDRLNHQSRLAFDANGSPIGSGHEDVYLTLDGRGDVTTRGEGPARIWSFTYDAAGRAVYREDPLGNSETVTLDAGGKPLHVEYADHNQETGLDETSTWEADYNALGLATSVRDRRNRPGFDTTVSFQWDGWKRLVRTIDAAGVDVVYGYDLRSRPTSRDENPGGVEFGAGVTERWDRDDRRYSASVGADPAGITYQTTQFSYDARNRVAAVAHPDLTVRNFEYDADSNAIGIIDETGRAISQVFDARGLMVLRTIGGEGGTTQETFLYDAASRLLAAESLEGAELIAHTEWTWDTLGKAETRTQTLGNGNGGTLGTWTTTAQYDEHGQTVAVGFSDGAALTFQPDARSRCTGFSDESGPLAQYLFSGSRVVRGDFANGVSESYSYEQGYAGQVARLAIQSDGRNLWGIDRRFDVRGLPVRERRDHQGATGRAISYDPLRRLQAVHIGADLAGPVIDDPSDPAAFGVKRAFHVVVPGNRDGAQAVLDTRPGGDVLRAQAYSVSTDGLNRYLDADGFAFGHDAAARVTQDDSAGVYYAWDFRGRMAAADVDGDFLSPERHVGYDAMGRRVLEDRYSGGVLASRNVILYGPNDGRPVEEITLDPTGLELHRVQYARTERGIAAERVDGEWTWRHEDADGSLLGLTDAAGKRSAVFDYLPFGEACRNGVLLDAAPGDISDVETDTPALGQTRVHVTLPLTAGALAGHELAISVPGAADHRYRTAAVLANGAGSLDVDDPDGLVADALLNLGAGCLVFESCLSTAPAVWSYDSLSDTSTFVVPGAGFGQELVGGRLMPNVVLPAWFSIIAVDPLGDWLQVCGNLTGAATPGDHYRVLPPVNDVPGERYLYRAMRHDDAAGTIENRAGTYTADGRSYDPRSGRWMTPVLDLRNPYEYAPNGTLDDVTPPSDAHGWGETFSPSRPCPARAPARQGFRFAVPELPGWSG